MTDDGDRATSTPAETSSPAVEPSVHNLGQVIEPVAKVSTIEEIDRQGVVGRRLAVQATFGAENPVELIEDLRCSAL